MVEDYAKQVNQRRLAAAAILKWEVADAARALDQKKREEVAVCTTRHADCTTSTRREV
jgi:hypothetical protein